MMTSYKRLFIEKYKMPEGWQEKINREHLKKQLNDDELIWTEHNIFMEAVIRVDDYYDSFMKKIDKFYNKYKNQDLGYKEIIDILNKDFGVYNFSFKYEFIQTDKDNQNSGINLMDTGVTKKEIQKSTVYCNPLIQYILDSPENYIRFRNKFEVLVQHELIHRGQFLSIKDSELRFNVLNNEKKSKVYYAQFPEIIAYANTIIEELRFGGFTDNQILLFINNRTINVSAILDIYIELFQEDQPKVLHKLYKYVYEYLKG